MNQTKGLILATVVLTAVTTFVRQLEKGSVTFRSFLGASFMGIFLTGIGMVNARLARNFCILIIFGVLLRDGGKLFSFTSQASMSKTAKASSLSKVNASTFDFGNTAGGTFGEQPMVASPVVAPSVPANASLE